MKNLIREIIDFYRYFFRIPLENKRIVFYSEHKGYWRYLEPFIDRLTQHHGLTLLYLSSDPSDPGLANINSKVIGLYSKWLLPFLFLLLHSKIVVMTLPDLNNSYIKRSVHNATFVYVFHSMVSTHMGYRANAFDHFDAIFCVGPFHEKEIRKRESIHHMPPKKLYEIGYPRLEQIHHEFNARLPRNMMPPTITIAPGIGKNNFLDEHGETIIGKLLEHGYQVIVRPHPETVRRTPEAADRWRRQFPSNPNITIDQSSYSEEALLKSDLLITDTSGISLRYAFGTERPVLFIDSPEPLLSNPDTQELGIPPIELALRDKIGKVVAAADTEGILKETKNLLGERERFRKRIVELREETIYNFGNSAAAGAKAIIDLISKEGVR